MRSSEPLRRLFSSFICPVSSTTTSTRPLYRCLHSSRRLDQRKSRTTKAKTQEPYDPSAPYTNHLLPQSELSVSHARAKLEYSPKPRKGLKNYSKEELEALEKEYTPEQIAAVMAGEEAISTQDIADQGVLLQGPMTLDYLDDFSQHRPVVDKNPETPGVRDPKTGKMPNFRWKDNHDLVNDLEDWLDAQPDDGGNELMWDKFLNENPLYDSKVNLDGARSYVAPEIFPIDDPIMQAQARAGAAQAGDRNELEAGYAALSKRTGYSIPDIKKFNVKFLVTRFVSNQTRLGKARSIYHLTIAGDGNGLLGIGEAKSQQATEARKKAILSAIKNIVPIQRYEGRTIFGNVKGKSGATELELFARHPGKYSSLVESFLLMISRFRLSWSITYLGNV